jgi:LPXTG-motif cell wall-anchored protein
MRQIQRSAAGAFLVLTTAAALSLTAVAAAGLSSAPKVEPSQTVVDTYLAHEWTGETIELDWTGQTRAAQRSVDEFHGSFTTVPGDRAVRELTVRNAAPTEGELTMEFLGRGTGEVVQDSPVDLIWSVENQGGAVPLAAVSASGEAKAFTRSLAPGESVKVTLGWEYAGDEEAVPAPTEASEALDFGLRLTLRGESPDPDPTPVPDPTDGSGNTVNHGADRLPFTGTTAGLVTLLAGTAGLTGLILLLWRRRRDRDRDEQRTA